MRVEALASGFGIPSHAALANAEADIAYKFGRVELRAGGKFFYFRTSPQGDFYMKGSLAGGFADVTTRTLVTGLASLPAWLTGLTGNPVAQRVGLGYVAVLVVIAAVRDRHRWAGLRAAVLVDFAPLKGSRIGELSARFDIVLGMTPES